MSKSRMIAATSILSVALLGAVLPAAASITPSTITKNVTYADLDLSNKSGQTTLYKRLKQAARNVCSVDDYRNTKSLADLRDGKACYKTTLADAVESINHKGLTQLHNL